MERHFDEALQTLKHKLLKMGALAEAAIGEAVDALIKHDRRLLEPIHAQEDQINQLQVENDETCLHLIALHQPTASDLRFLLGVAKINSEIERLGDHAVTIADTVLKLLEAPPLKPFEIIPKMVSLATGMVKDSLHAFVNLDVAKARAVIYRDDTVNRLRRQIADELLDFMMQDKANIARALNLILVAQKLEKIGDHATNIAEDVIFVVEGKDIRHHVAKPPAAPPNHDLAS